MIKPEISSAVRGLTSEVSAKALYTSGRSLLKDKLLVELKEQLEPRGITVEDVLLKVLGIARVLPFPRACLRALPCARACAHAPRPGHSHG